jgi:predicted NBD/HSP70 family sugar kinase
MPTLGLDIGGSSIKASLVNAAGAVVWEGISPRYVRPTLDQLLEALRATLDACPHDLSKAEGVGLCVPGLLNAARTAVEKSVNLPGLVGLPLADLARAALVRRDPPRLALTSDAHAAAHDVWSTESPALMGRLLCLSLGTGVGASVLDDGVPLHVSGASPGHIGQVDVSIGNHEDPRGFEPVVGLFRESMREWSGTSCPPPDQPIGPDGGRGSLEAYIGLPALIRRYGDDVGLLFPMLTIDHAPLVALDRAIRICHAIYRPHHIRLLGGVGIRIAHLVPALRERVANQLTSVARDGWTLASGTTDFHAARGAARLARQSREA